MKRAALVVLLFALIPLLATPRPAVGYPIPPQTLWTQVEKSDLVVLAEVVEVKVTTPRSKGGWPESIAVLRVVETWKGKVAGKLEVGYPASLICPAPPRYLEHKEVLAFLAREKGRWQTVGLSYGTLYPGKGLGDYREMVRRAVGLQSRGEVPEPDRIDWLVETASRPATRWHGLYPLEPEADEMHSFYDRDRQPARTALTPEQLNRIADGFISTPPVDHTLPMALALFRNLPSRQIDETAVAVIEGLLAEESTPWWIDEAFAAIFARYGDPDSKARTAPLKKLKWDDRPRREETIRAVWRLAKEELRIPKVPPAFVEPRGVAGVGADTPD